MPQRVVCYRAVVNWIIPTTKKTKNYENSSSFFLTSTAFLTIYLLTQMRYIFASLKCDITSLRSVAIWYKFLARSAFTPERHIASKIYRARQRISQIPQGIYIAAQCPKGHCAWALPIFCRLSEKTPIFPNKNFAFIIFIVYLCWKINKDVI